MHEVLAKLQVWKENGESCKHKNVGFCKDFECRACLDCQAVVEYEDNGRANNPCYKKLNDPENLVETTPETMVRLIDAYFDSMELIRSIKSLINGTDIEPE